MSEIKVGDKYHLYDPCWTLNNDDFSYEQFNALEENPTVIVKEVIKIPDYPPEWNGDDLRYDDDDFWWDWLGDVGLECANTWERHPEPGETIINIKFEALPDYPGYYVDAWPLLPIYPKTDYGRDYRTAYDLVLYWSWARDYCVRLKGGRALYDHANLSANNRVILWRLDDTDPDNLHLVQRYVDRDAKIELIPVRDN